MSSYRKRRRDDDNSSLSSSSSSSSSSSKRSRRTENDHTIDDNSDDEKHTYVPLKERRRRERERIEEAKAASRRFREQKEELRKREIENAIKQKEAQKSLVDVAAEIRAQRGGKDKTEEELREEEEQFLLEHLNDNRAPLQSAMAAAKGSKYTQSIVTGWRPPRKIRKLTPKQCDKLRKKWSIIAQGEDIPPPIKSFKNMRFPRPILKALACKGIKRPTPIQIQGIPVALAGRDMIGIAFTGSGKTLTFSLPMVMVALTAESKMPLVRGEGPCGMIVCPSRELAQQTHRVVSGFTEFLQQENWPALRTLLCMGGIDMREQNDCFRLGMHMLVATPGRLIDFLKKKRINLELCKYLALDEADRLIDVGFEDNIREMLDYFTHQRQTVLFSATMPTKVQEFALTSLIRPIIVNVGRAGAANLDVIQEVEYVKMEAKIVYLLECLQKTPPPTLVFASNQSDVDDIHEYLLLKGVDACSIHGGKDQVDRIRAIEEFKSGEKSVLVATDVASKGLDFPDIQHVINYDMPKEIEDYVHRIGRTGRCGKTGVATTFINREVPEISLLDLKHLLREAKQKIPPVLMAIRDNYDESLDGAGVQGCEYCGGPGHTVLVCPKLALATKTKKSDAFGYDCIQDDGY